jgi:hypothetical protein
MVRQASASSRDCCAATSSGSPGSCAQQIDMLVVLSVFLPRPFLQS